MEQSYPSSFIGNKKFGEVNTEKAPKRKKVFVYCRVSTLHQAEEGYSLKAQQEKCRNYCEGANLKVKKVYDECCSGAIPVHNRQGFGEMLNMLYKDKAHGICFIRLDRVARKAIEVLNLIEEFYKNKWLFICLDPMINTNDPQGLFVAHIMACVYELERAMIRNRTKEIFVELRRQNRLIGNAPIGKKVKIDPETGDKFLTDDEREKGVIEYVEKLRTMRIKRKRGKPTPPTLVEIADDLTRHNYINRFGNNKWTQYQVRAIVNYIKKRDEQDEQGMEKSSSSDEED